MGRAAELLASHNRHRLDTPINGGIMDRHFPQPVINTIQVDSLEEAIVKVEQSGGTKIHGPNEVPEVGIQAYCTDSEGNIFGLHQPLKK